MPVGTFGKIETYEVSPGRWRARTQFRDYDGERRPVTKFGSTASAASRALKRALADRTAPDESGEVSGDTKVRALIDLWLAEVDARPDEDLASGSKRLYRLAAENHLMPALGALRIREVTVPRIDRALRAVADTSGPGAAKSARSALSGVLTLAVQQGALAANPVRDATRITRTTKKEIRALSPDEVGELTALLRSNARAVELDLPDLIEWMLYTGCRIGEACAVGHHDCPGRRGDAQSLDLEHGTVEINATIVRKTGAGLVVQHRPKTAAGHRVLAMPAGAVAMVQRRHDELRLQPPHGIVFGSPSGMIRDPSNTSADLREVLAGLQCEKCDHTGYQIDDGGEFLLNAKGRRMICEAGPWAWITSHVFRKTVATVLDDAGYSARQIADVLGHEKPSMTQDVYMGRRVTNAAAAVTLDR